MQPQGVVRANLLCLADPKQTFASLRHRNYRLWFFGQAASLVGTWMQSTAQGFLVYELTHSPAFLGYVAFANGVPTWLLMLLGGVLSDRMSRRTLLLITQTIMMVLAMILTALTWGQWVQPWHILVLAFGLGIANAFDIPTRQSFAVELVASEDLGNAIGLNATMINLATTTGPAIAGITYALLGPAWCFALNAVSFLAVIGALLLIQVAPAPTAARSNTALDDLRTGIHFVSAQPMIRLLFFTVIAVTVLGWSFGTLLPAWAVNILNGDATTQGFLQSARGLGALIGAVLIASMAHLAIKGKLLTLGTICFPLFLLVFAVVRWLPLSLFAIAGAGLAAIIIVNTVNILVQTRAPEELRGRAMSFHSLSASGMLPLGSLLAGATAQLVGEPVTIAAGATILLALAILLFIGAPELRKLQ